jgi:hypothetical protein
MLLSEILLSERLISAVDEKKRPSAFAEAAASSARACKKK